MCVARWRTVMGFHDSGASGKNRVMLSSRASRPCSTSCRSRRPVNGLVAEAIWYRVSLVAAASHSRFATP